MRSTVELRETGTVGIGTWRWAGYGSAALLLAASGAVGLEAIGQHAKVEADPKRAGRDTLTRLNVAADSLAATGLVTAVVTWLLDSSLGGLRLEGHVLAGRAMKPGSPPP